jgi:hypothetical protein
MPEALSRPINWTLIANATRFYELRAYRPVEVPWVIPHDVIAATAPSWVTPLATPEGDLIGSGEQGLLYLALQGKLSPGLYQTTTACWRDDHPDELHGRHFVKNELMILTDEPTPATRDLLLKDAEAFFSTYLAVERLPVDAEPHQVDLVCAKTGIELGSYGIRRFRNVAWAYGTGCAEPRLSTVLTMRKC